MILFVRFHGHTVGETELVSGRRVTIGRSRSCTIVFRHSKVSRVQGEVFEKNGLWYFKDLSSPKQKPKDYLLNEHFSAQLPSGLEVCLDVYIENEKTHPSFSSETHSPIRSFLSAQHFDSALMKKITKTTTVAVAGICLMLGAVFTAYNIATNKKTPLSAQQLIKFADKRIVLFEVAALPSTKSKLIELGGLKTSDIKDTSGFCTGFIVAPGVVATANHCLYGSTGLIPENVFQISTLDGKTHSVTRVLGLSIQQDFAFLEVESLTNYNHFEFADDWEIGQKVYTIGNAHGEGLAIRDGLIAGYTEDSSDPSLKYLRFSAGASPGNSGGPLLNEQGEVVALTSAKTAAENYNIGIEIKELKPAFAKFVRNRDQKTLDLNLRKTPSFSKGNPIFSLAEMYFYNQHEWRDLSWQPDDFNDFQISLKLPTSLEDLNRQILKTVDENIKEKMALADSILRKLDQAGLNWESQTTSQHPLIVPNYFPMANRSTLFENKNNNLYFLPLGVLQEPPTLFTASLGEGSKSSHLVNINPRMPFYEITKRVDKEAREGLSVFSNIEDTQEVRPVLSTSLQPDMTLTFHEPQLDPLNRREFIQQVYPKLFFGKKGARVTYQDIPHVRPQSKEGFTINDFSTPLVYKRTLTDSSQRNWDIFETHIVDYLSLRLACATTAFSAHCISVPSWNYDVTALIEMRFKNFSEEILASTPNYHELIPTEGLNENTWLEYQKQNPQLSDFEVSFGTPQLIVKSKSWVTTLNLGPIQQIKSLMFVPALYSKNSGESGKWTALGVNFIRTNSSQRQWCYTGVEPTQYPTHYFTESNQIDLKLGNSISPKKLDRQPASAQFNISSQRGFYRAPHNSELWTGTDLFIIGACAKISKNISTDDNDYIIDSNSLQPFNSQKP